MNEFEIRSLRYRIRNITALLSLIIILQSIVIFYIFTKINKIDEGIVTKKLVINDDFGNCRIVISSRIDSIQNRRRKDVVDGILVIDKNGQDRLLIGMGNGVQVNGKQVPRSENDNPIGLTINDEKGNERIGLGYFEKRKVVLLGMDGNGGQEGLFLFLADKELMGQKVGLYMSDPNSQQVIYLGRNKKGESILNVDSPNKGRISLSIDSSANTLFRKFDFISGVESNVVQN